ncbi:MAG: AI-2E family transporter [Gammaproteobacteria bacterium]|nr:AI-2E family transporter [Gammaproteobacteria bacterium]
MSTSLKTLLAATCFVIVAAALQQAREIVVPFLLAIFIAIACEPPMKWLRERGLPNLLALITVIVGLIAAGIGFAALIGASITGFRQTMPTHYEQLRDHVEHGGQWLSQQGWVELDAGLSAYLDPSFFLNLVTDLLSGFGALLTNALLILLAVAFILLEALELPKKIQRAFEGSDSSFALSQFTDSVNRYLATKTLTSFLTGVLVAGWLALLGLDHAILWGLVAFLLNYIPNVGSILAAIPAVLLAWLQLGAAMTVPVILGYAVINTVIGQFLEAHLMGRRLGLSALVVFLSLVFWGWLLGPVGMLLSIPLTVIVKLGLESSPGTRGVAILLGPAKEPESRA